MKNNLLYKIIFLSTLLFHSCILDENLLQTEYRTQNAAAIYDFTNREVLSPIAMMLDMSVKYNEYANAENEQALLKELYFPQTAIKNLGTAENPVIKLSSLFTNFLIKTGGKSLDEQGAEWIISGSSYDLTIRKSSTDSGYKLHVKGSLIHSLGHSVLTNAKLHSIVTKDNEMTRNPYTYSISGSGDCLESSFSSNKTTQTQISFEILKETKARRVDYYDFSFNRFRFNGGKIELVATGEHLGSDSAEMIRITENSNVELSDIIYVNFHGITETVDLRRLR